MAKTFSKKNAQKYAVVHRPHDDPQYHDTSASEHILVPLDNPNARSNKTNLRGNLRGVLPKKEPTNSHVGEAALYGIPFDDSNYDYTQHLKPIGLDPEHSVFIPASDKVDKVQKKKGIDDIFVEKQYQDENIRAPAPLTKWGMVDQKYLAEQQDVADEITGFQPDMNPALREVLEALEDEAYVINEDVAVKKKKAEKTKSEEEIVEGEDDLFAELLGSGEVQDEDELEEFGDEWDIDGLDEYEDEHYKNEMAQFDNVTELKDLQDIDYQADVRRFQKEQKYLQKNKNDDEFDNESINPPSDAAFSADEEYDELPGLPDFSNKKTTGAKKRKQRHKKGAMSDVSGFSMTSSVIARSEAMTVLDDKYDSIINGYENYEEEQAIDEEENYQPFDMKNERADFESMLDNFLDNYELQKGGRVLSKKDPEIQKWKDAADSVSKGKLSMRRKREQQAKTNSLSGLSNSLGNLRL